MYKENFGGKVIAKIFIHSEKCSIIGGMHIGFGGWSPMDQRKKVDECGRFCG